MPKGPVSNFTTTSSVPGASMDSSEAGELTATRFGNFEVLTTPEGGLHLLGGGGFGKTYKARHVYLNQIVALKVINDRLLNDGTAKERFLREAQVVHQLRHPHIAHVLDFGEVKHSLYYAMEFCGGGNLENMVSRVGPLALPVALHCARQLAEALGCAHSHGFIHRDVKPANVMLTGSDDQNPQLKLVDFGLVKHLQGGGSDATAALTMTGQQFFTIQFASPEQLMEETLDARSDIFALGMTIWFLLKGSAPEAGSMASIVAKRLDARSYEAQLPTGLPAGYRAVLARLLEKDRNLRFQNTDEVLAALAAADAAPDIALGEGGAASGGSSAAPPGAPAVPPPSIAKLYTVLENLGSIPMGTLYRATSNEDNEQVAITMIDDILCQDAAQRAVIDKNVALLKAHPHETIARLYGLEEYEEGFALVQEWHRGVSLHRMLKSAGFISYSEALRVLLPIAQGADWTTRRGLPGVILTLDEIYLQPLDAEEYPDVEILLDTPVRSWPPFRVRLLPYVLGVEAIQQAGMTIATEIVSDPAVAFSCLLYHLVAGHAPRAAAKLSKDSYVTIGRFAEDSNRLLAACLAGEQDLGGCEGILRALNANEGVNFPATGSRRTTELRLAKTAAPAKGAAPAAVPMVAKGDGRSIVPAGDAVPAPAPVPASDPRDVAREAAEAQARQAAEDERLRQRQVEAELTQKQAEEARLRQQQADEEQARKEAESIRLKQEAETARQKAKLADEERVRKEAADKKQQAEEERARVAAEEQRRREEQAEAARAEKLRADEERARKSAEEKQLKERLAEEERLKKQQLAEERARLEAAAARQQEQLAAEARLEKQRAEELRAQAVAEEKRLQQRQAEEEQRKKQLADEERAQRVAEEKRLKQLAAAEAAQKKQQADEERAKREAEEKRLKQVAAEEARRAKQLADEERAKQVAAERQLESARAAAAASSGVAAAPGPERPPAWGDPTSKPPGGSPPAIWIAGVLVVCAAAALLMLPFLTPPKTATSRPPATIAPLPPAAPALTGDFVFLQGIAPANATVKVAGKAAKISVQDQKVVVSLDGVTLGSILSVEAPGFDTQAFPLNENRSVENRVTLRRRQEAVGLQFDHDATDYATINFEPVGPLPEDAPSVAHLRTKPWSFPLAADAKISLPTGIYRVVLQGGPGSANIQPRVLDAGFAVTPERTNTVVIPASFAGRYNFDFIFKPDADHAAIKVRRTLVIDPGLNSGHVDDIYADGAPKGTKISDLSLDERGSLHGIIRFTQRTDAEMGYDEQFDLSSGDQGFVIVSGGWEIAPTDPAIARKLQNKLKNYQVHLTRPDPQTVKKD